MSAKPVADRTLEGTMSRFRTSVALFALALLASGCGAAVDKVTEKATEKVVEEVVESNTGGDVDIQQDGDTFSIQTEDGSMSVDSEGNMVIESDEGSMTIETGESLPDDFPDVPLPSGLEIDSTSHITADGNENFSVSGLVENDAADVFEAWIGQLEDAGFTSSFRNDSTSNGEFYGTAAMEKDETLQVSINCFSEESRTRIIASVTNPTG